jgi:hypothetical protein
MYYNLERRHSPLGSMSLLFALAEFQDTDDLMMMTPSGRTYRPKLTPSLHNSGAYSNEFTMTSP